MRKIILVMVVLAAAVYFWGGSDVKQMAGTAGSEAAWGSEAQVQQAQQEQQSSWWSSWMPFWMYSMFMNRSFGMPMAAPAAVSGGAAQQGSTTGKAGEAPKKSEAAPSGNAVKKETAAPAPQQPQVQKNHLPPINMKRVSGRRR